MKQTLKVVLVIGGLLAIFQGATAASVFNPSLTMYEIRRSAKSPLVKTPNLEVRKSMHQAGCRGTAKIESEDATFPMISMNK